MTDGRKTKWIEYVDELILGNTPNDPTMQAFPGELIDFEFGGGVAFESYKILKGPADPDPLSCGVTRKIIENEHTVKVTLKITDMSLIPYIIMGATSTTYTPGITQHPISIGMRVGAKYCMMSGCVLTNHEVNFKDRKSAGELTLEFMGVERTYWGPDYIGEGSHASPVSSTPLTLTDVTDVLYDGLAVNLFDLIMDSFKFGIKNNVESAKDGSAVWASKIVDWNYTGREISVDLGCSLIDMTMVDQVLAGANDHTLAFTVNGKTYTISSIAWTNAPSAKISPAEVIGMNLQNDAEAARLVVT